MEDLLVAPTNVVSSNIKSIEYYSDKKILEIRFHTGSLYQYKHVAESTWNALVRAESKGKFFNENIKDYYPAELVDESKPVQASLLTPNEQSAGSHLMNVFLIYIEPYKLAINELLSALPIKRDWLDPVLEKRLRELAK